MGIFTEPVAVDPWALDKLTPIRISQFCPSEFPVWICYVNRLQLTITKTTTTSELQPDIIYKLKGQESSQSFRVNYTRETMRCSRPSNIFPFQQWVDGNIIQFDITKLEPWVLVWLTENGYYP